MLSIFFVPVAQQFAALYCRGVFVLKQLLKSKLVMEWKKFRNEPHVQCQTVEKAFILIAVLGIDQNQPILLVSVTFLLAF